MVSFLPLGPPRSQAAVLSFFYSATSLLHILTALGMFVVILLNILMLSLCGYKIHHIYISDEEFESFSVFSDLL